MADREHVCPSCRAKRACALVGHDWAPWMAADMRGIEVSARFCYRCPEREYAPTTGASS